MPFTLAHPAIIMPLAKIRFLSLPALIIGSMSPDFQYLILLKCNGHFSHTLVGVFLFCFPIGLLLFLFWRHFAVYWKLEPMRKSCLGEHNILQVSASLLIGALSHVFWDAFTHNNGLFVVIFPALQREVCDFHRTPIYIYKLLQHGSTLVGLSVMIYYFVIKIKTLRAQLVLVLRKAAFVVLGLQLALFFGLLFVYIVKDNNIKVAHIIVKFLSAGFISLTITHFAIFFYRLKKA